MGGGSGFDDGRDDGDPKGRGGPARRAFDARESVRVIWLCVDGWVGVDWEWGWGWILVRIFLGEGGPGGALHLVIRR
jgi:hypothetical protein